MTTHYTDVAFLEECDPEKVERNAAEYRRLRDLYYWGAQDVEHASREMVWTGKARDLYALKVDQAPLLLDETEQPLYRSAAALDQYAEVLRRAREQVFIGKDISATLDELMSSIGAHAVTRAAQAAEPMRRWEDLRATTGFRDWVAELGLDVDSIREEADRLHSAAAQAFGEAERLERDARNICVQDLRGALAALPDFDPHLPETPQEAVAGFDPLAREYGEAREDPITGLAGDGVKPSSAPGGRLASRTSHRG